MSEKSIESNFSFASSQRRFLNDESSYSAPAYDLYFVY